MKSAVEILKDMLSDFISSQSSVTYLGKESTARGIFYSIANTLAEIWNDVYQMKRQMQVSTAKLTDLDTLGARDGLTRNGATKSSVALVVSGTAGTVIPQGTTVLSIGGVSYSTVNVITLGNNSSLSRPLESLTLGDIVMAESTTTGSSTQAGIKEITIFNPPITGVQVTNLLPTVGGKDAETDDEFRKRIVENSNLFSQGTQTFYEVLAREANPNVILTTAKFDPLNGGTIIYVAKNTLVNYTSDELQTISDYVYDRQRALNPVTCLNATYKQIEIAFQYNRDSAVLATDINKNLAIKLSEFINLQRISFGAVVGYQQILQMILSITGIKNIILSTFLINGTQGDVVCGSTELPSLTKLVMNDGSETTINLNQIFIGYSTW